MFGLGIGYKLFHLQFIDGDKYRKIAEEKTLKSFVVNSSRGNIFSEDGSLLATSTTKFDVFFDSKTVPNHIFSSEIQSLSIELSKILGDDDVKWLNNFREAKNNNNRYLPIIKNIDLDKVNEFKKLPIFKYGSIKGGLIIEKKIKREYPLGKVAERTIGYEKINKDGDYWGVGLEHAYGSFLRGKNGKMTKRKISNGQWKVLESNLNKDPIDGLDINTTLNTYMQDVVHDYLLEQTEKYEADHSTAVLMEVATGKIRAISNFGRTDQGKYYEKLNYAVGESIEPGSTFKLMTIIAALEDQVIDTLQMIDTENGEIDFYGFKVKDSRKGGYGQINAMDIFRLSSNTGIVKIISEAYKNQSEKFVDRLFNMGLNNSLNIEIKGEPRPKIPHPLDSDWNGLSLPWMSYGYGVSLTPLQILSFYNAVANDGIMVKPTFLESSNKLGALKKNTFKKQILNPSICSKETLSIVKKMLYDVVHHKNGTAKNIKSNNIKIAGKTGTAQVGYGTDKVDYISSFVGYFPAENPKYSCIVVINKPNKNKGYYGSDVAAPVFKRIAEKISSRNPVIENYIYSEMIKNIEISQKEYATNSNNIDS
jgi:cell division protein FtsI (penicillin-binding protein 3)